MSKISEYQAKATLEDTDLVVIVDNDVPETKVTKNITGATVKTFAEQYDNSTSALTATTKSEAIDELQSIKVDKVAGSDLVEDAKVALYDAHLIDETNPHNTTASEVGAYTTTEVDDIADTKVDKVLGKELSDNNYSDLDVLEVAKIADKVSKVVSTDDAIVAFNGTTGDVKNSKFTMTSLRTQIGKAVSGPTSLYPNDNLTGIVFGPSTLLFSWAGGIVPTTTIGSGPATYTVGGIVGALVSLSNRIGVLNNLTTTSKTDLVTAINEKIAKVTSTDNAIVRFDGTTGAVQNSGVIIDDSGNVELTAADKGVIMKSANGTRYRLTVDDSGNLETEVVV